MKINFMLPLALLMTWTFGAQANFYFEPYAGYAIGSDSVDSEISTPATPRNTLKYDNTSTIFGAKAGYLFRLVAIGIDYMSENGSTENSGNNGDMANSNIGGFINFSHIQHVFTASYFFSSSGTHDESTTSTDLKGTGYKLGYSFKVRPKIALNLDYYLVNYDQAERSGVTFSTYSHDHGMLSFGISAPFNF